MNPELVSIHKQLKKAKCPEDVFGKISTESEGTKTYHRLAKVAHADKYTDKKEKALADEAFVLLKQWWEQAKSKLAAKTYGDKKAKVAASTPALVTIQSKKATYAITDILSTKGELADIFHAEYAGKSGTEKVLIKVVRSPKNNDLMTAERNALDALSKVKQAEHRVPVILEALTVQDVTGVKRTAHVFPVGKDDLMSLDSVLDAYQMQPIDPAHVAWMGSRLWTNLGIFHANGLVHGAITPDHCLICAENHGMVVVDWCYSVKIGEPLKAISPKYRALYPKEVFDKKPATQATDIYMGAFMLSILLGAQTNNPNNPWFPASVPIEMQGFLRSCLLPAQHRRPQDAIELAEDWKKMLQKVFGKPRFVTFKLPAKVGAA